MLKVTIDSVPVQLEVPEGASFAQICAAAMKILLVDSRAISECKLDGKVVVEPDKVDTLLSTFTTLEILSRPLKEILLTTLQQHVLELKQLEQLTEQLVTDCLLAEPQEIVDQWSTICNITKKKLSIIPTLAPILDEKQLEAQMEPLFKDLNTIMTSASTAFSTADVVSFSDILENNFHPWIQKFRSVIQTAQTEVEKFKTA